MENMSEKKPPRAKGNQNNDYLSREEVEKLIEPLLPIFARAALGDFSKDVDALEVAEHVYENDIVAELYSGVQVMLEVIRATIEELGDTNITLEAKAKQLEERQKELAETKKSLEIEVETDTAILASIGSGLVVTNQNEQIILANDPGLAMLGYRRDELVGKYWYDVLILEREDGTVIPQKERPFRRASEENTTIRTGLKESYYYQKRGRGRVPVALTVTPIPHTNLGVVNVFRDITKEKEIDREKSEFISIASHQLRTPLSSIGWHAEMLSNREVGPLTPKQTEYLIKINRAKHRMAAVVRNLLDVSRMELGTFELRLSEVDVAEEAQGVIDEIEPISRNSNISISLAVAKNFPKTIQSDRNALRAILQNLVTNAVRYTKEQGTVKVELAVPEDSDMFEVKVSDTGVGIPKSEQKKIFTKFFRASNVQTFDTSGTGLGLYSSKQFVDAMGGEISFTSKQGEGTTFIVRLPAALSAQQTAKNEVQ